jgi:[NiFe] hydrogenase assembly HybE family chaperone
MTDEAKIANTLIEAFQRVHREHMAGLPILHPGLSVAVIGARDWHGDWVGMLLTPWCMNLVLVPGAGSAFVPGTVGYKQVVAFPAGGFEFISSEEEGIGAFAACSMFSPMQAFVDQAAAVSTAEAIMVALFEPEPSAEKGAVGAVSDGTGISRRDLLRGRVSRRC